MRNTIVTRDSALAMSPLDQAESATYIPASIEVAKVVASDAPFGSDLERQAGKKLTELQRSSAPDVPTSAAAQRFVGKFHL
jgi:hypothetical protein